MSFRWRTPGRGSRYEEDLSTFYLSAAMENLVNHYVEPSLLGDADYETYSEAWRTRIDTAIHSSPDPNLAPLFHDKTGQCISSLSFVRFY